MLFNMNVFSSAVSGFLFLLGLHSCGRGFEASPSWHAPECKLGLCRGHSCGFVFSRKLPSFSQTGLGLVLSFGIRSANKGFYFSRPQITAY